MLRLPEPDIKPSRTSSYSSLLRLTIYVNTAPHSAFIATCLVPHACFLYTGRILYRRLVRMTDCPEFVARNLVRTFSNTLNNNEKEESSKSPSQKKLEEALREEVQQQDSLAALLQEAISE